MFIAQPEVCNKLATRQRVIVLRELSTLFCVLYRLPLVIDEFLVSEELCLSTARCSTGTVAYLCLYCVICHYENE